MDTVDLSCANSSLPWLWIIEYLARFKQVDMPILHDLVEMAPDLPEDLAKSTTEIVAFRCLEDLFGARNGHVNESPEGKVGFALSESCEDVLQHILQETSVSDLIMAGPELLKWDVHPFIMHKRASVPKCALEQLKDTILEGNNQLAASLMESSGLMCVNKSGRTFTDDVDHNARTWTGDGTGTHVQTMATNDSLISPTSENGNELSGDNLHNTNLLHSKRNRNESNDLAAENMAGHFSEVQGEFDLHLNAKMPQDSSRDETDQNVPRDEVNVTEPRTSTDAAILGTQQKDSVDESKGQTELFREEEMSSDNDEYQNERIDVAKKKSHFFSSQCLLGNDSLTASGLTEQNLCVKCNKDGQLLVCDTNTCPLVIHENCLGFPAKFDEKGNFHCPFCAYSVAISEYLEVKKKASLARRELAAFIHMGLVQRPNELAKRLHRKEQRHSRQNGDEEIYENGHLEGQEHYTVKQNGQDLHDVSDHLCQERISNRRQSEPSASCFSDKVPCREVDANVIGETICFSNGEKVGKEDMVKECPSVRVLEGLKDQAPANPRSENDNLIYINTDVAPMDQREAEGGIQKEDLQQAKCNLPDKPVFASNTDGDDTFEGENDKFIISNYSTRFRRQERQYTYPAIPQLRRKKVPWTAKEEEMLKKGVRKFTTSVNDRNIPWKKILEFGGSVFLRGRTTIDLKDKWRNMCKGSPRTK